MIIIINSDKSYFKADERPLKQEIGIISNYIIDLSLTGQDAILYGEGLSGIILDDTWPIRDSWTWPRVKKDTIGYLEHLEHELNGVLSREKLMDIERKVGDIRGLLKQLSSAK